MLKKLLIIAIAFFVVQQGWAQGTIRGTAIDDAEAMGLIGATVVIDGTSKGTTTDLDGTYELANVEAGTYTVVISYISYETKKIENVIVKSGEVTVIPEIRLGEQAEQLETVVVVSKAFKNTESAVQTIQRKSITTLDAISSQTFSASGDSDAGAAMKKVVGVSVQGGKYIYVRGLGDRYSKTLVNGAEIPGLDPDKNTVQMDLFPTNLIDNIIVYKTFTPNLPGSFTGGLVDVTTKDFPETYTLKASAGVGFNPTVHFNENFLTYEGGNTDWLGYDDGTRAIPSTVENGVPGRSSNPNDAAQLTAATQSFNKIVEPVQQAPGLDHSFSIALGNQKKLFGKPLGFIASLSYKNNKSFYENGITGRYKLTENAATATGLNLERYLDDSRSSEEVMWGAMLSGTLKLNSTNKIGINLLSNQSGTKQTRFQDGENPSDDYSRFYQERTLAYQERSLNTLQVKGNHAFGEDGRFKIDWINSYSIANMSEPDLRFFNNTYEFNNEGEKVYKILSSIGIVPTRYWRDMMENTIDNKLNLTYNFTQWDGQAAKIKVGGAYSKKWREFRENIYEFDQDGTAFSGDFSEYLSEANLWTPENQTGIFLSDDTQKRNQYDANMSVAAGYAMVELPLTHKLKTVAGVRAEKTDVRFTSYQPLFNLNNSKLIDDLDILPSVGLIYEAIENKMNVRLSYNRTLARPSFKEIAPMYFFDVRNSVLLIGNPELKSTLVDNVDFRWEYFFKPGQVISASAFYKNFTNPIEISNNPQAPNGEWIYRNIDRGQVYGVEFEFKKNLDFINALQDFSVGTNVTLVKSVVAIADQELEAIRSLNPDAADTRVMFGQSPFIINSFISYRNNLGTRAHLSYNTQGERLTVVSLGGSPNVYEQAFPLLNFKVSQRITPAISLSLSAKNLLNSRYEQVQEFKGVEYPFQSYKPGCSFSFGFSYDFAAEK